MPTPQQYIDQAVSAGIPRSAIDAFIAGNKGDYSRIMSAIGPEYIGGGGGSSVTTYSPAQPYSTVSPSPAPYASPTVGSPLTASSPSDGIATGVMEHGDLTRPTMITIRDTDTGGAPAAQMAVLPQPSIPMWAILAAFGVLALLFLRK